MLKKSGLALLGLIVAGALVAALVGIKLDQFKTMGDASAHRTMPPTPVNAYTAEEVDWTTDIPSVGTVVAIQGTTITTETEGTIARILFTPGGHIEKGQPLLKLDDAIEQAQLREAEVTAKGAKLAFDRARELSKTRNISRAEMDTAETAISQAEARVAYYRTLIAKKTILAPFGGRLGITSVREGQFVSKGTPIVSLQALNPVYVNFSLPQQYLSEVKDGLTVQVTSDAFPGTLFRGRITAINPDIDPATRTVRIQATLDNPEEQLRPGMFVSVSVQTDRHQRRVIIPATSVLYGPYGNSVYVIRQQPSENQDASQPAGLIAEPRLVRLGEHRGDFVVVESGVSPGEQVVSTGSFKLIPGMPVVIDNTLAPEFTLNPVPENN